MNQVRSLIEKTITTYCSPDAQVKQIDAAPMSEQERGWSGAEIRRYIVTLQNGDPIRLITKTMPRKERRVMHLLSQEGQRCAPFAYTDDLTTEGPVLTCLQDLGSNKIGLPDGEDLHPPSPELDQQVARTLASLHLSHRGQSQQLTWLPPADAAYVTNFLVKEVWRSHWEEMLVNNRDFAAEFARYTPQLERAADKLARSIDALWQEGDSLTLTHGEVHGDHLMLYANQPYLIDWGWSYYGPFYLDLPAYFTPHTVLAYHQALVEQGYALAEADFNERFQAVGPYVGFKYLCSGIWQWPPGPTALTGRRILHMIYWASKGSWPERAFAVTASAWSHLLANHNFLLALQRHAKATKPSMENLA